MKLSMMSVHIHAIIGSFHKMESLRHLNFQCSILCEYLHEFSNEIIDDECA